MNGDDDQQPATNLAGVERSSEAKIDLDCTGAAEIEAPLVGYGRPPKHRQFKPGISGNPKGKPRGPRNLGAALEAFLSEKVTVTEQGEKRKIAKRDVIAKQLVNKAASGDLAAIRFLTQVLEANAAVKSKKNAGGEDQTTSENDDAVIAALVKRIGGPNS